VPTSPGLELVIASDYPRAVGVLPSEYQAPAATTGLFARDIFHSLGLYVDLLGQGLDKQEQGTSGVWAYPAVTPARNARLCDRV